jgi:hypothetical protein
VSRLPAPERQARADPELDAVVARMPPARPHVLAVDGLTLLAANAVAVHYLLIGEMTPLQLVVLVALEALMLAAVGHAQRLLVPARARIRPERSGCTAVAAGVFGVAWLLGMYTLVFSIFFDVGAEVSAALADPLRFLWQPQIRWPLLLTAAGALADAVSDHRHFREHGGYFVSTVEFNGLARLSTLLLGAVPFFVPLLVFVSGISVIVRRLERRELAPGRAPSPVTVPVLVLVFGLLALGMAGLIGGLFAAGVRGWVVGYISAKLASEIAVLALPNLIARVRESACP